MSVRLVGKIEELLPKGARVLDAGCGEGGLVKVLNASGFHAEGFDITLVENEEHRFLKHDLNDCPFPYGDGEFDAVVASFSFRHVKEENTAKAIYELGRVTKNGGLIFIYDTERLIADRVMSFLPWHYFFWERYGNDWQDWFRPLKRSLMIIQKNYEGGVK